MPKKIIAWVVLVALLAGIFHTVKNSFARWAVTTAVANLTGAPVKIGGLSLSLLQGSIRIQDFHIDQPKGYPNGVFVDIPEIRLRTNIASIFKGCLYFPEVYVNLKEAVIIRDKNGRLNVDVLKVAQTQESQAEAALESSQKFQIDNLTLSLGRVILKDYSRGEKLHVEVYAINIQEKNFQNFTSPEQLVTALLVETLKHTAIKSAMIYGAAAITGVALLPVGAAVVLTGKDDAQDEFKISPASAFDVSFKAMEELGEITDHDKESGFIKAKVDGNDVSVDLIKTDGGKVLIKAQARKFFIPNLKIARGVLYQIEEKIR